MDQITECNRMKNNFMRNFSNNVREPMNSVILYLELLKDSNLDTSVRSDYENRVNENTQQLLAIFNNCLQMSSTKVTLCKQLIHINEVCRIVVDVFSMMWDNNQVTLEFTPGLNDSKDHVYMDDEKLVQILYTLLLNAFQNTSYGQITLGYTLEYSVLRFYVKDTGTGIKNDELLLIYNHFLKVDYALKNNGVGRGLSICRNNVQMMGGTLSVKSQIGAGSTFFFTIPYECEHGLGSIYR